MLFTLFVNLNNVSKVLFIICNTDTNLYDFYIKKEKKSNFFPGWIYSLPSFMNKHVYSMDVKFHFYFISFKLSAMPDCFDLKLRSSKVRFSIMNVMKQFLAHLYTYILYKIHI